MLVNAGRLVAETVTFEVAPAVAGARMIVFEGVARHEAGVGARRVGRDQTDEGLESDLLGIDARQNLQPLADRRGSEGGADRRERVGAVALTGLVGSVTNDAGPTNTPVTLLGLKTANWHDDVAAGRRVAGDVADGVAAAAHQGELIEAVGQRVLRLERDLLTPLAAGAAIGRGVLVEHRDVRVDRDRGHARAGEAAVGGRLEKLDLTGCEVGQVHVLAGLHREHLRTGRAW